MNRSKLAALSAGAMFLVATVIAPAAALADTGNTNTIKVIGAPTINPPATGGSFTVNIVANGSVDIGGAGAGLAFDNTKLTLTALAKGAAVVTNGAGFGGFPSVANTATFIATANTNGQIPNIGYFYTDGSSFDAANTNVTIYSATFTVSAVGDSVLAPNQSPAMLDGTAAGYGNALTIDSVVNGNVVNSTAPVTPVFSISAPASASVNQGATNDVTVTTAIVQGTPGAITLSTTGLPAGVSTSFSPNPVSAGSSSTLTFTATAAAAPGTFAVTVSGTDGTTTQTDSINLTVVGANDFSIAATPASVSITAGNTGTTSVSVAQITPTAGTVALSVTSSLPSGVTTSFSPTAAVVGTPSTLTFTTTAAATPGTYSVTVSGDNGTNVKTTTVTLTVNGPAPANAQDVNVNGTMDGGFIGLSCPSSVAMPLVRGNTNRTNVPCSVYTNTVWNLNTSDPATDAYKGFMVTGRPVDNVANFALANSMHVLSGASIVAGEIVYATDVDLVTGGSSATGTNSATVPLVLSQFVAGGDRAGAYGIQILFSAVSVF